MTGPPPTRDKVSLLIATAKGAFILVSNARRSAWTLQCTWLFGQVVNHVVRDPRDGRTLLVGTRTGHLGPTVLRSEDNGKTWEEARRPPAFRKARDDDPKRVVEHTFWLTPGHPSEPGVLADFLPDPYPEFGHDPHCVVMSPADPDRLYQQNHCGIYRLDRPGGTWERIGERMPRGIGDIGFPIAAHPRDPIPPGSSPWTPPAISGNGSRPRTRSISSGP